MKLYTVMNQEDGYLIINEGEYTGSMLATESEVLAKQIAKEHGGIVVEIESDDFSDDVSILILDNQEA